MSKEEKSAYLEVLNNERENIEIKKETQADLDDSS